MPPSLVPDNVNGKSLLCNLCGHSITDNAEKENILKIQLVIYPHYQHHIIYKFSEGSGSNGDEDDEESSDGEGGEDKPDGDKNNEEGSEDIGEVIRAVMISFKSES